MSYAIEVTNPGVNRVILDGSSPLYVIPPVRTVNRVVEHNLETLVNHADRDVWIPPFGTRVLAGWRGGEIRMFFDCFITRQSFEIQLKYPLSSIEPPLVFVSQKIPPKGIWAESPGSRYSWMANTTTIPIGVAGRWTGMRFLMFATIRYDYLAKSPADKSAQLRALQAAISAHGAAPDLSEYFILVGHGISPITDGYGLVVYDTNKRVVFNSNSNIAKAIKSVSNWQYLGRSGSDGIYDERWAAKESAPNQDAYVLFHPHHKYKRYNGEVSMVGITSVKGTPSRVIVGGRSGSPAHTPITWIEPMKSIERW